MSGLPPVSRALRVFGALLMALVMMARAVPSACCMDAGEPVAACCDACPSRPIDHGPPAPADCPATCSAAAEDFLPPASRASIATPELPAPVPQAPPPGYRPDLARCAPQSRVTAIIHPGGRPSIHRMNCVLRC